MAKVRSHLARVTAITIVVLALCALGTGAASAQGARAPVPSDGPAVTFTLLTPLPTQLAVGQSATIGVRVQSSQPFVMAIALSNAYYPGRAVRFDGSPAQPGGTSADLFLTIIARDSTAGLGPVENWPADEDWSAGVAPVAVAVGARFAGGAVVGTQFPFAVTVP